MGLDYEKLGFKAGVEIHQRLKTGRKLFCDCSDSLSTGEPKLVLSRKQRVVKSELGEVDSAVAHEFSRGRTFLYQVFDDTVCLVCTDSEPPHEINKEALDAGLQVSLLLDARVVDEVEIMRKIVIDGSDTSGFQRTALVALDGSIPTSLGQVSIPTISIEEESSGIVERTPTHVTYRLDRLGIPLIEIGTGPDIKNPEHAKETALLLGNLLRSTGKMQRGLGSIRQDLNVSISEGSRCEIKGVQDIDLVPKIVENEVLRQKGLVELKKELVARKAKKPGSKIVDVSKIFEKTSSSVVKKAFEKKGGVLALKLEGFSGLLGKELCPGRRFGTELSDYAKTKGVGGLFHSDEELKKYGIGDSEISAVKKQLSVGPSDAFVLVADRESVAYVALEQVVSRAKQAFDGVPGETRQALPNGSSRYMRPIPGAARMYPETDVPPVLITRERLEKIGSEKPESFGEKKKRFVEKLLLSEKLATDLAKSQEAFFFDEIVSETRADPTLVATTLTGTLKSLSREKVAVENVSETDLKKIFSLVSKGDLPKDSVEQVLREVSGGKTVDEAASGLSSLGEKEVEKVAEKVVLKNKKLLEKNPSRAFQMLMGDVMKELRGKADGALVARVLKKLLEKKA